MKPREIKLEILSSRNGVAPFVNDAVAEADDHKDELGFFPKKVFHEYAQRECLLIATAISNGKPAYAGHLLFDCRFPKCHVLQIVAARDRRRTGVSKALINRLKESMTEQGFIAVQARVAEDLGEANQFWAAQGFYVQAVKKGGTTRNRTILVRSHELETPQLFPSSGLSAANPLGLDFESPEDRPLFLLDLNVLFDLGPRRARNAEVVSLFRAERSGACSLAISTEIVAELKRTAPQERTDPMLDFALVLPTFAPPDGYRSSKLLSELGQIVFSSSPEVTSLSESQKSDLRHLATVVQHRLSGLITSDGAILDAAPKIARQYGIQVLSPLAFRSAQLHADDRSFETTGTQTLALHSIKEADVADARKLLGTVGVPAAAMTNEWAASAPQGGAICRFGAWVDHQLAGYAAWPSLSGTGPILARIAVDETAPHPRAVASILLRKLLEQRPASVVNQFSIECPTGQTALREAAWGFGFRGDAQRNRLYKIALRSAVTSENWTTSREQLHGAATVRLPEQPPSFRAMDQQVPIIGPDGNRSHVSIETVETLLGPLIFCLPGRPAVITPVQRGYAEGLLGHSAQLTLLPESKAATHLERHYLSDPKTLKHFKQGAIIFFYESGKRGGSGSIVAIGRVRRSYLKPNAAIGSADLDPSVLDAKTLSQIGSSEIKTVTTFDNVMILKSPVPMKTLKALGCGRPTDLISTQTISDAQMAAILEAGFGSG